MSSCSTFYVLRITESDNPVYWTVGKFIGWHVGDPECLGFFDADGPCAVVKAGNALRYGSVEEAISAGREICGDHPFRHQGISLEVYRIDVTISISKTGKEVK